MSRGRGMRCGPREGVIPEPSRCGPVATVSLRKEAALPGREDGEPTVLYETFSVVAAHTPPCFFPA